MSFTIPLKKNGANKLKAVQYAWMRVMYMDKTKHQTSLPRTAIFLVATAVLALPEVNPAS